MSIVFPDDPNGFIVKFSEESIQRVELIDKPIWSIQDITHGVIFDDGEEFTTEMSLLKLNNVPLRAIKIMITRVVNIKIDKEYQSKVSSTSYEYIGRGSYWGNPYSMFENGDREEVIRKFKYDFDYEKFPNKDKSEVYKLTGKRLGCFCKPQACHGDVLAGFLNSWDDGK
ncbi:DUF4326 domain-containing protein [Shewanella sp. T24-MNA-CIBAN-0130]|uniref:DUF4326 domain-containing protein n=1 Tax=Shewanella sp. T24-MNA-CIBAN-0130 TaxID=3140470 RepID=UPI00332D41ED